MHRIIRAISHWFENRAAVDLGDKRMVAVTPIAPGVPPVVVSYTPQDDK
jgi:hypothetical protein